MLRVQMFKERCMAKHKTQIHMNQITQSIVPQCKGDFERNVSAILCLYKKKVS